MAKVNKTKDIEDVEIIKQTEDKEKHDSLVLARQLLPPQLPIIPISGRPLFPKMMSPLFVDDDALKQLVRQTYESDSKYVGLVLKKGNGNERNEDGPPEMYDVGVVAEIVRIGDMEQRGPIQAIVGVLERMEIKRLVQTDPYIVAEVIYHHETQMKDNEELRAFSISVVNAIKELIQLNPLHKEELSLFMSRSNLNEPGRLADFAATMTTASAEDLQDILETVRIRARLKKVLFLLKKEIDINKLQAKIHKQIEDKLSSRQREFFLREQLKAIKKELGLEKEGKESEIDRFTERLKKLTLTQEAKERIDEEIEKLKLLEPSSPEFNVSRTYLDWLTILPWGVTTKDNYDITKAAKILDQDHYGLDDVKQRILEFLSVGILKGSISGSILCFVGPPGVGKTSIGQSIARAIGRNFFRFSVGGMRDEAEIKGHRRTYIGALPGKFIQTMKTCKSANPVIMLDEIDKISSSFHGDPASALLEVLDPEQNRDFLDHYLDVRFDLSEVFFICTANQLDTIPRPLLDRMEVIKIAGYILQEKLEIAKKFLIPKQLEAHGLKSKQWRISPAALSEIIDGYAREAGVRSLEKHLRKIMRKSARHIVEGQTKQVTVRKGEVPDYLGKRIFFEDRRQTKPKPGLVMGLAWTAMGGDTLYIEATPVETGQSGFKQTGQLGSVMVESSEIAYTYVRSYLNAKPKCRDFFKNNFIHLHVPAGATPKDGPSAGITMASALYSLATQQPIRPKLAMTGELTLTGRVMPIGGVKEKTIAAKRANVTHLVFPKANKEDFEELPEHIKKGLTVSYADTFDDVVRACFKKK